MLDSQARYGSQKVKSLAVYIWFTEAGQGAKHTDPKARDTIFDKSLQKKLIANIKKNSEGLRG